MGYIELPLLNLSKPGRLGTVDWKNPITDGLVFLAPLNEHGGTPRNIVTGFMGSQASWGTGPKGSYANTLTKFADETSLNVGGVFSAFAVCVNGQGTGTNYPNIFGKQAYAAENSNQGWTLQLRASGESRVAAFSVLNNNSQASYQLNSTSTFTTAGQEFSICGTSDGATNRLYINGIQEGFKTHVGIATCAQGVSIGTPDADTPAPGDIKVYIAAMWNRTLSAAEVASLHANPWQLLRATRRRIYAVASGGTTYTQTINASVTANAALGRRISVTKSASVTVEKSVQRTISKSTSFSSTISASIAKTVNRAIGFTVSAASSLAKQINKTIGNSVTASATLAMLKVLLMTINTSLAMTMTVTKRVNKTIANSLTASLSVTKLLPKTITTSVSTAYSIAKLSFKTIANTATATVTLNVLKVFLKSLAFSVSSTMSLQKTLSKIVPMSMALSVSLGKRISLTKQLSVSMAYTVSKFFTRVFAFSVTTTINVPKQFFKVMTFGVSVVTTVTSTAAAIVIRVRKIVSAIIAKQNITAITRAENTTVITKDDNVSIIKSRD